MYVGAQIRRVIVSLECAMDTDVLRVLARRDNNRMLYGWSVSKSSGDSVVVAPEDEAERDESDEYFAQHSDDQWTPSLTDQVL